MEKTDLGKADKTYYSAKTQPQRVYIGKARYVSIKGQGDPSGEEFAGKVGLLYSVVYTLKFMQKAAGKDFVVAKLEGLWWYDQNRFPGVSMSETPAQIPRGEWEYRLLIRIPDEIPPGQVTEIAEKVTHEKKLSYASGVEFFRMEEGDCVQILHKGPFDQEPETLQKMAVFMEQNSLQKNGLHHEIYLSDFRKTAPENLKTILRSPVK